MNTHVDGERCPFWRRTAALLLMSCVAPAGVASAAAEQSTSAEVGYTVGATFREIGYGARDLGREIGQGAARFGRNVGGVARGVALTIGDGARTVGHAARDGSKALVRGIKGEGAPAQGE